MMKETWECVYLFKLVFFFPLDTQKWNSWNMGALVLNFWENFILFPVVLHQFTFLPTGHVDSLFSTSSPTLVVFYLLDDSHSKQVWSDISLWFWFAFPWWLVMLSIFSCACWPSVCHLWGKKIFIWVLLPFF